MLEALTCQTKGRGGTHAKVRRPKTDSFQFIIDSLVFCLFVCSLMDFITFFFVPEKTQAGLELMMLLLPTSKC